MKQIMIYIFIIRVYAEFAFRKLTKYAITGYSCSIEMGPLVLGLISKSFTVIAIYKDKHMSNNNILYAIYFCNQRKSLRTSCILTQTIKQVEKRNIFIVGKFRCFV